MLALGRTIVPGLLTACAALAAVPAVTLDIQLETSGAVSVTSVSRQGNLQFAPFIAAVIGCRGRMTAVENVFGTPIDAIEMVGRASRALRRARSVPWSPWIRSFDSAD